MPKAILNSEFEITYPDTFHIMDDREMEEANYYGEKPKLCLKDPENHIIISFAFKKYGALAAALAGQKGTAESMQKKVSALMKNYGYSLTGFCTQKAGEYTADGFDYRYDAQGISMAAKSLVLKTGRTYYYIHCYYRQELADESLKIIDDMLSGIKQA